jgi:hypothetical protein
VKRVWRGWAQRWGPGAVGIHRVSEYSDEYSEDLDLDMEMNSNTTLYSRSATAKTAATGSEVDRGEFDGNDSIVTTTASASDTSATRSASIKNSTSANRGYRPGLATPGHSSTCSTTPSRPSRSTSIISQTCENTTTRSRSTSRPSQSPSQLVGTPANSSRNRSTRARTNTETSTSASTSTPRPFWTPSQPSRSTSRSSTTTTTTTTGRKGDLNRYATGYDEIEEDGRMKLAWIRPGVG